METMPAQKVNPFTALTGGCDPSFSGYNDEQSSASWQDNASDLSAIGAGKYIGGVVTWLIPHIPPSRKAYALKWQPF